MKTNESNTMNTTSDIFADIAHKIGMNKFYAIRVHKDCIYLQGKDMTVVADILTHINSQAKFEVDEKKEFYQCVTSFGGIDIHVIISI